MKNETKKNEQAIISPLLHKRRYENTSQEFTPVYLTRWISALIRNDKWFHLGCGQIARVRDYPKPKYSRYWYLRYQNKNYLRGLLKLAKQHGPDEIFKKFAPGP